MLHFDEQSLVNRLGRLSPEARVLFALACASRLAEVCKSFVATVDASAPIVLDRIVRELWEGPNLALWSDARVNEALSALEELFPDLEEESDDIAAYADDALAALSYALRSRLAASPQEAAWAARRTYEAFDQCAIRKVGQPAGREGELALLRQPIVQSELQRQERDLSELESGEATPERLVSGFRARAFAEAEAAAGVLCAS